MAKSKKEAGDEFLQVLKKLELDKIIDYQITNIAIAYLLRRVHLRGK